MTTEELFNELSDLLNDEVNTLSIILEEEEQAVDPANPEKAYKSGANDTCPAGHKWVYVFCVNSHDFFGKLIVKTTRKVFNKSAAAGHVALSFDKSLTRMYSFVIGSNFRNENLKSTYKPDATFSLYKIAVPDAVFLAMQDAVKNIAQLKGTKQEYKYNLKSIFAFFMGRKYQDKFGSRQNTLFCSQFVARMFATAGMPVFSKPDYRVQPYEFMKNKKFKFCYKGSVKYYDPSRVR